ncbi:MULTISPECIES: alpha/beta hydrolase [Nocardiaceae]|uniref:Esterase family protein n=1 Tax=Rhodococcoides kroppenstedtii TaxID=293050 RepID=A0ABS7NV03_9NOCA|nr:MULTISPECIES: alpha/beta hydrolase family protein [Rhodococcus]AMY20964.1 Diacylglycerol acyltransferase/mycolyltransferase Ag85A [Rhodococcus sp. PBTS 1]MBY6314078.1 esterase family protein [Rhodococcus kroppenstedtii]MBY6321851.1 esterase family protein [Rhodococcus kroppenstedtii]MBY6400859.1 esterase family protein [Rhodococcus kroppenstedtii]
MRRLAALVGACLATTTLAVTAPAVATADPAGPVALVGDTGARVVSVAMQTDRRAMVSVFSPSMGRDISVQVLLPADRSAPRPSLYMLDGVSAGEETNYTESTWTAKTDAVAFFADKPVNVVLPIGGRGSYYADWQRPDPVLGVNMWETFLTRELPPLIDAQFSGNGVDALMGLSMGAQGAMNLIAKHPSLYTGVAAFSGCYDNRSNETKNAVRTTVGSTGGDATNMWGSNSDPAWADNDPSLRVDALRGKQIYVSSGTGLPGPYEAGGSPLEELTDALLVGGPLEAAANLCTNGFVDTLNRAGVPATVVRKPWGTHSWRYWQDEMRASWPVIARALGV